MKEAGKGEGGGERRGRRVKGGGERRGGRGEGERGGKGGRDGGESPSQTFRSLRHTSHSWK